MPPSRRRTVAVAGATGYIGIQCVELVCRHPELELVAVTGRSSAGRRFDEVVPGSAVDLVVAGDLEGRSPDVVMAALPHGVAAAAACGWLSGGAMVVDMSADFRIRDAAAYQRWYGLAHPAPELCGEAVYGLVELHRDRLREARLIAAPGCYPTAALLATWPGLAAGLVEPDLVVDAKSGVSGAGRSPALGTSFAEVNESVRAYGVSGHRHRAEMLEQLGTLAPADRLRLAFVPHLVPMTRGILITAYLRPRPGVGEAQLIEAYAGFCAAAPCLRFDAEPPATKSVSGTNLAALSCGWQDGVAVVTVAVDNLVKGAGGQGIQALNVALGFDEIAGLNLAASWP